jgi:epoxyqueuosine reductase
MNSGKHSEMVKRIAQELGFDFCGIAKADQLPEDARRLEQWLAKGYNAGMQYMQNHFELRIDPRKLFPGAKSVITLLFNYFPSEYQSKEAPHIAKYAWGTDYHFVIKDKLNQFLFLLQEQIGDIQGRGFVDSAPVLERSWAVQSGLGWIGKNANLITKQKGSFLFIATLISDLELSPDAPFATHHCGSCTRCIDACPTGAIVAPAEIDANKCISYLTIELKDALIPQEFQGRLEGWAFGCDICQDVCPWNRFSQPHREPAFTPLSQILNLSIKQWQEISEDNFRTYFKHSPLARAKYKGLQRNLSALKIIG